MAAGKNKAERWFTIYWDDAGTGSGTARDLTGDLVPGSVSGGGLTFDEVDLTGVSNAVYNYLSGHAKSEISAQFHMNNTATTGATTVLIGSDGGTGTLTLTWGAGTTPTTGDTEWYGEYVLLDVSVVLAGNKFVHQAKWKPTGSIAPDWTTKS